MSQISLPFDWTGHGAASGDSFIVSEANRMAVKHLEGWHDWPVQVSVLSGPPRSGKSTLGRHFARQSGGRVIDDAQGQGDEALFHAWNSAQLDRRPLLMIAQEVPQQWTIALPDLRSRLAAVPHIRIAEPDDALVRALIERGLHSGGSAWAADLPEWLHQRIERSYAAISEVLGTLHTASLSSGRKISVPFAKETLQSAGFLPIVWSDPESSS